MDGLRWEEVQWGWMGEMMGGGIDVGCGSEFGLEGGWQDEGEWLREMIIEGI